MNPRAIHAATALACLVATSAWAADNGELERRIQILSEEIQKIKNELAVSEEPGYSSSYGLGPAASKIYKVSKGLSVGGYGEGYYSALVSDRNGRADRADLQRFILYAGYKFTDRILFNSEIEFEHASTGEGGEVAVEFAALDFLLSDRVNVRVGEVLIPMGITNELHEPTLFHGVQRPQVERDVIPTTWREMGVGLFGDLTDAVSYKLYLVNGLDAAGFGSTGVRSARQNASKTRADDWALVARLDYEPVLGVTVGGSAYWGDSGQNQEFGGDERDVFTQIYELHGQYRRRGLELKALVSWIDVDDARALSQAAGSEVAENVLGWYAEAAYDVLPLLVPGTTAYLAPFFRYERVEFDQARGPGVDAGPSQDYGVSVLGLTYKPIPNVVLKADYRNFVAKDEPRADEINLGFGFIF
ncbi:MAG: hypothetical protein GXP50_08745 [Deltaproteobacteria bacterium]|nr:hypothetical protein [Deltaproteobacteria bacterium]